MTIMSVFRLALVLTALALAIGVSSSPHAARATGDKRVRVSVFTEPEAGNGPVLSLIRNAKKTILLEIYELTDQDLVAALESASQRGVRVRVLLERHPFGGGSYASRAYSELQSDGISVRWANEGAFTYTHEKSMDIDGRIAGIFTFNFSYSSFSTNREFGVIDRSRRDAHAIGAIFKADWDRTAAAMPASSDLVISPLNSRHAIIRLIDQARRRLDLYEEEVADPGVEHHLISAAARHVRVRLITSTDSSGVEQVRSGGVRVRLLASPYVHAKAMVGDGERTFIGSENISATSLDNNREMGIILHGHPAAKLVESTFAHDWKAAAGGSGHVNGKLSLQVSAHPQRLSRGQLLTIGATTAPAAGCTIVVVYPDGYVSHASELGPRTANDSGSASWSWHMGSSVTGKAHATVTCSLGRKSAKKSVRFEVVSA